MNVAESFRILKKPLVASEVSMSFEPEPKCACSFATFALEDSRISWSSLRLSVKGKV